jgi:hypothetical protein
VPDEARVRAAITGAEKFLKAWHGSPPTRELGRHHRRAEPPGRRERADHQLRATLATVALG